MDLHLAASIASSAMFIATFSYYMFKVAKGHVRVSVSTFIVLTITSFSQAVALYQKESYFAMAFMTIAGFVNFLIVFFGLRTKNFEFKLIDKISLLAALIGIILWYVTNDPALNVYILTVAILISFVPAVRKAFRDPESEDRLAWFLTFAASLVFLGTITSPDPIDWIVQARQMLFATLMAVAVSKILHKSGNAR